MPTRSLHTSVIKWPDARTVESALREWDMLALPVPVDLLVYTQSEWEALDPHSRFYHTLAREAVWVYTRDQLRSEAGP